MPTHDSKRKKLAIMMDKMAPGVTVALPMAMVALPMATADTPSIPIAKFSVDTALLLPSFSTLVGDVNRPNNVDPRRQHAMKQEKTVPYGVPILDDEFAANLEKYELTTFSTAGGQFKTKIYMAASNRDWMAPTSMIFGLVLTTFTASRMVGFDEVFSSFDAAALPSLVPLLLLPTATFSFHRKEANNPPMIRKPMDSSKGPVGPRDKAAAPAIWPARMATIESPA